MESRGEQNPDIGWKAVDIEKDGEQGFHLATTYPSMVEIKNWKEIPSMAVSVPVLGDAPVEALTLPLMTEREIKRAGILTVFQLKRALESGTFVPRNDRRKEYINKALESFSMACWMGRENYYYLPGQFWCGPLGSSYGKLLDAEAKFHYLQRWFSEKAAPIARAFLIQEMQKAFGKIQRLLVVIYHNPEYTCISLTLQGGEVREVEKVGFLHLAIFHATYNLPRKWDRGREVVEIPLE